MPVYKQCITDQSTIYESAGYPSYPSGGAHRGIDTVHGNHLAYAPMAGTVIWAQKWDGHSTTGNQSWGNAIRVQMDDGRVWLAAHFASQIWKVGDTIARGQYIGQQGKTGNVTGIHTHWELWSSPAGGLNDPSQILGIPNGAPATYDVEWDAENPPPPEPPSPATAKTLPLWMYLKPIYRYGR